MVGKLSVIRAGIFGKPIMTHLLRKVSFSKWEINKSRSPNNYTADAITGCTRTQKNTLSVWEATDKNFDSPEVKSLIVALATTMERPDSIDLVWLDGNHLSESGIEVAQTLGSSKFQAINDKHRDLSNLDHEKLAIVGHHIVSKLCEEDSCKKIGRSQLINMVNDALQQEDTFELGDLEPKWQEAINKLRAA